MFQNCIYEFICEQSCADHHCVRGCDHGADVSGRNHDLSCLVTVSVTDDRPIDCLKCDGKANRRHFRRCSPQFGNLADSNQHEFRVLTISRCAGGCPRW